MTNPQSIWETAVFVDASAFFALVDRRDQWHDEAARTFEELTKERAFIFTSNLVVAETHALIGRSLGPGTALEWLRDEQLRVLYQTKDDHLSILALFARFRDKSFSYADAFSFLLMDKLGTRTAFTFDDDFRQLGFQVIP